MQKITLNAITKPLISQLIRSGTSIGANYFEANGAFSRKDFKNKIFICKKEAKETQYWLGIISEIINNDLNDELQQLKQEAKELGMIFSAIGKNT